MKTQTTLPSISVTEISLISVGVCVSVGDGGAFLYGILMVLKHCLRSIVTQMVL